MTYGFSALNEMITLLKLFYEILIHILIIDQTAENDTAVHFMNTSLKQETVGGLGDIERVSSAPVDTY